MLTNYRLRLRRLGRQDNLIWLIAGTSLAFRIIYVFFFTDYRSHLTSDMRWYAQRAIDFAAGNLTEPHQWLVWPPFYHMFLGATFRLADLLGLHSVRLVTALTIQMILAAGSIYLVYGIARHILQARSWALGVAAAYAFTFPLIYMNSFLLSENLAIPLLILSVWLILLHKDKPRCLVWAGVTLALAIAVRPALLLLAVPFVIYLWHNKPIPRLRPLAIFSGALLAGLLAASGYVAIISGGQVAGLGANGGVNFLLRQCRIRELIVRDSRAVVGLTPTQFTGPEMRNLSALEVRRDFNDQKFFMENGWECIRANGIGRIIRDLRDLPQLWVGRFFPWFPSALGLRQLLYPWLWGVALATLLAAILTWLRRLWRSPLGLEFVFLWSLIGAVVLTGVFFPVEPRFMMQVWFAIYILLAAGLHNLAWGAKETAG